MPLLVRHHSKRESLPCHASAIHFISNPISFKLKTCPLICFVTIKTFKVKSKYLLLRIHPFFVLTRGNTIILSTYYSNHLQEMKIMCNHGKNKVTKRQFYSISTIYLHVLNPCLTHCTFVPGMLWKVPWEPASDWGKFVCQIGFLTFQSLAFNYPSMVKARQLDTTTKSHHNILF